MFPTPVTTTAGLNQSPPAPLPNFTFGASTNNMAHATATSVEEWANGLSFNQNDGTFTMADHWMADTNMTPQAEFGLDESLLYQASFCTIDDTFTNLHGTRTDGNI